MAKVAGIPNFKASVSQTKNGNDYKKTKLFTTIGTTAGLLTAGADVFAAASDNALKGMSLAQKAKKVLPNAGALLGIGLAAGLITDFVINKLRAKNADKNPMTTEQKFVRDIKSKDYTPRYDVEMDEVVLVHKKDQKLNYAPKHNVYRLQNDGSVALIGGKDFVPPENIYTDNGDGTGSFKTHTEKPFIENNPQVKKYINAVKKAMFHVAQYDKNYSFKYDKEKDTVVLSRMPAMSIDGPVPFKSFNIKSDGTISVVSADGKYEREIEDTNGIMIFDDFADESTSVRKFKAALNDALGAKESYTLSYNKTAESLKLTKKDAQKNNNDEDSFSPYYLISQNKYGHKGGAIVSYVYSNHEGDPLFSPNAKIILDGSQEMLELLNSFKEKNAEE